MKKRNLPILARLIALLHCLSRTVPAILCIKIFIGFRRSASPVSADKRLLFILAQNSVFVNKNVLVRVNLCLFFPVSQVLCRAVQCSASAPCTVLCKKAYCSSQSTLNRKVFSQNGHLQLKFSKKQKILRKSELKKGPRPCGIPIDLAQLFVQLLVLSGPLRIPFAGAIEAIEIGI